MFNVLSSFLDLKSRLKKEYKNRHIGNVKSNTKNEDTR